MAKKFAGMGWTSLDAFLAVGFVVLLVFGSRYVALFYAALGVAALGLLLAGVRQVRRVRERRRNPREFWADKI